MAAQKIGLQLSRQQEKTNHVRAVAPVKQLETAAQTTIKSAQNVSAKKIFWM